MAPWKLRRPLETINIPLVLNCQVGRRNIREFKVPLCFLCLEFSGLKKAAGGVWELLVAVMLPCPLGREKGLRASALIVAPADVRQWDSPYE